MSRTLQHPRRNQLLKSASRQLVGDFGGQVAVGAQLGKRHQRYSDTGLANTPDFLTIDEVGELEDNTVGQHGYPVVTRALARRQGFVLMRASDELPDGEDWLTHVSKLSAVAGQINSDITRSAADCDGVTVSEIKQHEMEEQAERLMDIAASLYRTVQLAKGGK